jgi:hypothetical protein
MGNPPRPISLATSRLHMLEMRFFKISRKLPTIPIASSARNTRPTICRISIDVDLQSLGGFSCLLFSCSHRAFSLFPLLWWTLEKLPLFSRCALRAFGIRVLRAREDVLVAAWRIRLAFCSRSFTTNSSVKVKDCLSKSEQVFTPRDAWQQRHGKGVEGVSGGSEPKRQRGPKADSETSPGSTAEDQKKKEGQDPWRPSVLQHIQDHGRAERT